MKNAMSMCGNSLLVSSWCQNQKGIVNGGKNSLARAIHSPRFAKLGERLANKTNTFATCHPSVPSSA
jgi:hypothetical protein